MICSCWVYIQLNATPHFPKFLSWNERIYKRSRQWRLRLNVNSVPEHPCVHHTVTFTFAYMRINHLNKVINKYNYKFYYIVNKKIEILFMGEIFNIKNSHLISNDQNINITKMNLKVLFGKNINFCWTFQKKYFFGNLKNRSGVVFMGK